MKRIDVKRHALIPIILHSPSATAGRLVVRDTFGKELLRKEADKSGDDLIFVLTADETASLPVTELFFSLDWNDGLNWREGASGVMRVFDNADVKTYKFFANDTGVWLPKEVEGLAGGNNWRYIQLMNTAYLYRANSPTKKLLSGNAHLGIGYAYLQGYPTTMFPSETDILGYWWGGSYAPVHIGKRAFDWELTQVDFRMKYLYLDTTQGSYLKMRLIGMKTDPLDFSKREHIFLSDWIELQRQTQYKNDTFGWWTWKGLAGFLGRNEIAVFGLLVEYVSPNVNPQLQDMVLGLSFKIK